MGEQIFDAVIIGGGPGGSSAATFLARAGKRVLLLEKERFPRFHIGESLLPYNRRIFHEMGVLPELESAGFPVKLGAQFHLSNSSKALKLTFRNGCFTRETTAFQVERATFDHILLKHAARSGAEVREGWTASRFTRDDGCVLLEVRDEQGGTETLRGRFLIDASGRANVTGNQENLRVSHPHLRKLAIFSHFQGVVLDPGPTSNDIVIVRFRDKWFWIIPLSQTKTSVGCVMDQEEYAKAGEPAEDLFNRICRTSAEMRRRMNNATRVAPVRTTTDFSYYNRRLVGPRLLRVGDAAGFMDPIFSAGVYLAMYSGKLAARAVCASLAAGDDGGRRLRAYEKEVARAMGHYWKLVEGYYTQPFLELLMEPRPRFHLPDAITAVLAGELHGGWAMSWRQKYFFLLTKIQGWWRLVPKINFDDAPPPADRATNAIAYPPGLPHAGSDPAMPPRAS